VRRGGLDLVRRHCCQISPAASRSRPVVCLILSAADTMSGMRPGIGCLGLPFPVESDRANSLELMVGHERALLENQKLPTYRSDA
jgi:hypothetical protein